MILKEVGHTGHAGSSVVQIEFYFDSYGLVTPMELQRYLKKANEGACIQRNTDEIQPRGTSICGYLCLKCVKET